MLACNLLIPEAEKVAMPFIVHGSKGETLATTIRLRAVTAVAKARDLVSAGWRVFIERDDGNRHYPDEFDHLISHSRSDPLPLVPDAEPNEHDQRKAAPAGVD